MSFQGDVRGIGLAELLQGLARGRKEGTLTLASRMGQPSVVGLREGRALLLPVPDEDPEHWRARARDAWADETRVDHLRMAEVAKAQRLEDLYLLLDGGDVHFRFEPGDLVGVDLDPSLGKDPRPVLCEGIEIECLLLDYARIQDGLGISPGANDIPRDTVPCVDNREGLGAFPPRLLQQCDSRSTVQEIADRLGWPIRQARLMLFPALQAGGLREANAAEVFELALGELRNRLYARAGARLSAWCRRGPGGPLESGLAESLETQWLGGCLTPALATMETRAHRSLLRRLDHGLANASQVVVHWIGASRLEPQDRITRIHRMAAEFREGCNPDSPSIPELLDWARDQRDTGHPWRAGPALVMAAKLQPTATAQQLELGTGLVAAGRAKEGSPWVLAGAKDLIEKGQADRAVAPLRTLLSSQPRNRECRQLLSRARRESSHVRRIRNNLLLGLIGAGTLAAGAMVQVQMAGVREARLNDVRRAVGQPQRALVLLQEHFGEETTPEVMGLRKQIKQRQRSDEETVRDQWLAIYQGACSEAASGDPIDALLRIRELPPPPNLKILREPWPVKEELYTVLLEQVRLEVHTLGDPPEESPQQVAREDQLEAWIEAILVNVLAEETVHQHLLKFTGELDALQDGIEARREVRRDLTKARLDREALNRLDDLYRRGQAYARTGDLVRALNCWRQCVAQDETGRVKAVLRPGMERLQDQVDAITNARQLAHEGKHDRAMELLRLHGVAPTDVILPWRVESYPSGATVTQGGGRPRTTPFVIETTDGEAVELVFDYKGHQRRTITFDSPANTLIHLERSPLLSWKNSSRVDAIPVPVGTDHIVVDRKGGIVRLGPAGETRWSTGVETLSGIARAPVFMPGRPGDLLLLTEEGNAWILSADDGGLVGPWPLGSVPVAGPLATEGLVLAHLADGRRILWTDGVRPTLEEPSPPREDEAQAAHGSSSGFAITRARDAQGGRLQCPWSTWLVEPQEKAYLVYQPGLREEGFPILRRGVWVFLAWQPARPGDPAARLWVSDGAGLRAYTAAGE